MSLKDFDLDTVAASWDEKEWKSRIARELALRQTTLTNRNEHGTCKNCGVNFDGAFIWDTGYQFALEGKHYSQNGVPASSREEAFALADEYAEAYGATRYCGKFGSHIMGIEDPYKYDGVSYWKCLKCEYTWDRFTGKPVDLKTS